MNAREPEDVAIQLREAVLSVRRELSRHLIGMENVTDGLIAGILARGHVLLEGGPGLGKTRLIKVIGQLLQLDVGRVQFTPDLMPSDILGGAFLEPTPTGPRVAFKEGPVFTHLLLADEINRANPRTQAALLEAMAEQQVTVGGETRPLPRPFFVLATNNPIEMEGTYPLPEAQADRFLMKLVVKEPTKDSLLSILELDPHSALDGISPLISRDALLAFQTHVASLPAADSVKSLIADLVLATQPEHLKQTDGDYVQLGASPRAAQGLFAAARARGSHGRTASRNHRRCPCLGGVSSDTQTCFGVQRSGSRRDGGCIGRAYRGSCATYAVKDLE